MRSTEISDRSIEILIKLIQSCFSTILKCFFCLGDLDEENASTSSYVETLPWSQENRPSHVSSAFPLNLVWHLCFKVASVVIVGTICCTWNVKETCSRTSVCWWSTFTRRRPGSLAQRCWGKRVHQLTWDKHYFESFVLFQRCKIAVGFPELIYRPVPQVMPCHNECKI